MARIKWDKVGERRYETGIDQAVLYLPNQAGVPWNGLTEVSDSPDGGAVTSYWQDGVKYLDSVGPEDYKATLSAYTYPDEFEVCQGVGMMDGGVLITAQQHQTFSLSYRTKIGNDVEGDAHAYRLHLVFNATVAPLSRDHKTLTGSAELDPFKWDITAVPVFIPGFKPTAHVIIDTRFVDISTLQAIETILYGDDYIQAHFPTIDNFVNLLANDGSITITDNGDGTWTALGPNEFVQMLPGDIFQITNANVNYIDDNTYTIQDT